MIKSFRAMTSNNYHLIDSNAIRPGWMVDWLMCKTQRPVQAANNDP